MDTNCERCTCEISEAESNNGDEFGYGILCNDCYAELSGLLADVLESEDERGLTCFRHAHYSMSCVKTVDAGN